MSSFKSAASRALRSKLLAQNPRLFDKAKRGVGLAATIRSVPNFPTPFLSPGKFIRAIFRPHLILIAF